MEMNFCPDNGGVTSQSLAFNEQLLPYTDLAFSEGAYTDGPNGYTTDGNWQLEAGFSRDIAVQKKGQLLVFNFDYHKSNPGAETVGGSKLPSGERELTAMSTLQEVRIVDQIMVT